MMKHVDLSVITPVFNGETYLQEVIESVISQNGLEIQMIIVNDGSTDSSLEIAQTWQSRHPEKIEILDQENAGEATAVNNGMALVRAEFIAVVNADDPLLPGHSRKLLDALLSDPLAVVAYPDWLMIDAHGATLKENQTLNFTRRALVADLVCLPGPGAVIRVSSLGDFPVREKQFKYVSDYVLWLRMSSRGHFVRVPETLATWRQHALGATATGNSGAISSEIGYLVKNNFFDYCGEVISSKWMRSARAHASYYAALDSLANKQVKGRRLLLKSFLIKPYPNWGYPTHHRSFLAMVAVFAGPVGRTINNFRRARRGLA
jgi:glycosyltransferase involved in cell wall biosynthesis